MHFIPSLGVKYHPIHRMRFRKQELFGEKHEKKKKTKTSIEYRFLKDVSFKPSETVIRKVGLSNS